jgi:hypothetical protein
MDRHWGRTEVHTICRCTVPRPLPTKKATAEDECREHSDQRFIVYCLGFGVWGLS